MLNYIQCNSLPKFWYHRKLISYLLLPFSAIYRLIIWLRRFYYHCFPESKFPVPIIIVGNITVGGTGKTPLVIFLAEFLKNNGYIPGIVSRGYGRKTKNKTGPITALSESNPDDVGDEALLIASRVNCPVLVDINRCRAVKKLIETYSCNIIISDDGLQHYALARDIEIVMIDANFKFGNGFCLPAGPLREPISRLKEATFTVKNFNTNLSCSNDLAAANEHSMVLEPIVFRNINDPTITKEISEFKGQIAHAVAGIGIPDKFFQTLQQLGLKIIEYPFPDHHVFSKQDFSFISETTEIVIMTEKDAVKCAKIATKNFWYLEAKAKPSQKFAAEFLKKVISYNKLR